MAHSSTFPLRARRWSFFYDRLKERVRLGDIRTGFAQPKPEAAEESLTLAGAQRHPKLLRQKT
jgi:hypothetical protein